MKNKGRVGRIFKQVKSRVQLAAERGDDPFDALGKILVETIARVEVLEEKLLASGSTNRPAVFHVEQKPSA